jgi:two-component system alkaline phosphatase synthesis response regulator PhoP
MQKINKKVLILVVEDERVLIETLEEKLKTQGFDVIKAVDGEEGLKLALTEHPDLILLDLLLPKVDGITVLNKLRDDPWGINAAVIVLTNLSNPSSVMNVSSKINVGPNGIDEYVVKANSSLDNLVERIKNKLEIAA